MDILLELGDIFIIDYVYAYLFPIAYQNKTDIDVSINVTGSSLARDNPYRQFITLFFGSWFIAIALYFTFATLFYHLIFDKRDMSHPKFLKNQIWLEIKATIKAVPIMAILVSPFLLLIARGYAKLYDTTADGPGWWYNILQIPLFLLYTDFCLYWIHRFGHHPRVYKHPLYMHKLHHRFVIPTPYYSYAIHPIEGFALSLPYLTFPFILPLQKMVYLGLCAFVITWIIGTHDGEFWSNNPINPWYLSWTQKWTSQEERLIPIEIQRKEES